MNDQEHEALLGSLAMLEEQVADLADLAARFVEAIQRSASAPSPEPDEKPG